ncbi:MAG: DUF1614 domain-containing protein [Firmicutes bacterium]|nr:DUF1614 domain-containing protein [Bacillota bacterium]
MFAKGVVLLPIGLIILLTTTVLVFFGVAQRVLDRMNLTDGQALLFLILIIGGSFFDIPIAREPISISINVGGAIVPLILVYWLVSRAGTGAEKWRGVIAGIATGVVIWGFSQLVGQQEPAEQWLDPLWSYSLIAGVFGYLAGRSRRSAFIAGVLGIITADLIHLGIALARGTETTAALGGAGALDAVVLAGVIAVVLAEVFGESRERLGGGPVHDKRRPAALDNEEFLLHEFADELGSLDEEDDEGTRGRSTIDVNAVGITHEDLEVLARDKDAAAMRRHILRVETGGELMTLRPGEEKAYAPAIANAAEGEEPDED